MGSLFLIVFLSYFLGNFFPALFLARLRGYTNFRLRGSGNLGTANVWRTGHKLDSVLTLTGDAGKGALAIFLAQCLEPSFFALACAGLSVVLGHLWPMSLNFKGGKGVATTFGVLIMFSWPLALTLATFWSLILVCTRLASVASLTTAVLAPVLFSWLFDQKIGIWVALLSLLMIFAHRSNIRRLIRGREHRI